MKEFEKIYKNIPQERFDHKVLSTFQRILKHYSRVKQELLALTDADYDYKKYAYIPIEGQIVCDMFEKRDIPSPVTELNKLLTTYVTEAMKGRTQALQAIEDGKVELRKRLVELYGKDHTDKLYRGKYGKP